MNLMHFSHRVRTVLAKSQNCHEFSLEICFEFSEKILSFEKTLCLDRLELQKSVVKACIRAKRGALGEAGTIRKFVTFFVP